MKLLTRSVNIFLATTLSLLVISLNGCAVASIDPNVTHLVHPAKDEYHIGQVYELIVDMGYDIVKALSKNGADYRSLRTWDDPPQPPWAISDRIPMGTRIRIEQFELVMGNSAFLKVNAIILDGTYRGHLVDISFISLGRNQTSSGFTPDIELLRRLRVPRPNPAIMRLVLVTGNGTGG